MRIFKTWPCNSHLKLCSKLHRFVFIINLLFWNQVAIATYLLGLSFESFFYYYNRIASPRREDGLFEGAFSRGNNIYYKVYYTLIRFWKPIFFNFRPDTLIHHRMMEKSVPLNWNKTLFFFQNCSGSCLFLEGE